MSLRVTILQGEGEKSPFLIFRTTSIYVPYIFSFLEVRRHGRDDHGSDAATRAANTQPAHMEIFLHASVTLGCYLLSMLSRGR